jgi:hypothetical protein
MEDRLELIEDDLGINSFMADDKIVTADGTVEQYKNPKNPVGVGSTVPPVGVGSTATSDNVGVGSTATSDNVGVGSTASDNVGVGSTAPSGTTQTDPDTSVDGEQAAPADVGVGSTAPSGTTQTDPDTSVDGEQAAPNVGVGSTATSEPADPDFS